MNKRDAKNGSKVCKQMKPWIYNVIQRLSFQNNYVNLPVKLHNAMCLLPLLNFALILWVLLVHTKSIYAMIKVIPSVRN